MSRVPRVQASPDPHPRIWGGEAQVEMADEEDNSKVMADDVTEDENLVKELAVVLLELTMGKLLRKHSPVVSIASLRTHVCDVCAIYRSQMRSHQSADGTLDGMTYTLWSLSMCLWTSIISFVGRVLTWLSCFKQWYVQSGHHERLQ